MPEISYSKQTFKLIGWLALIVFIIFVFDRLIGTSLDFFYFNQKSGTGYQATYAIDSTEAEIIVFGSSRANHHYVTEIFENRLSMSCYNVARDGNFILYNYAVFKSITKRYNPKLLIFDITPEDLEYNTSEYDRLSRLLPYYDNHTEIRETVLLKNPFEKVKLFSKIYPYNSLILFIAMGNLEYNKKRAIDFNGYEPAYKKMTNIDLVTFNRSICNLDTNKINALQEIITICSQRKIELFFVYSPVWRINMTDSCNSFISKLCLQNDIDYIDMSNDSLFLSNPQYFADKIHLNDSGARKFTELFINIILQGNESQQPL